MKKNPGFGGRFIRRLCPFVCFHDGSFGYINTVRITVENIINLSLTLIITLSLSMSCDGKWQSPVKIMMLIEFVCVHCQIIIIKKDFAPSKLK